MYAPSKSTSYTPSTGPVWLYFDTIADSGSSDVLGLLNDLAALITASTAQGLLAGARVFIL